MTTTTPIEAPVETPVAPKRNHSTTKTQTDILLMAHSGIRESFAETDHGTFGSIAEAELRGREVFKTLDWLVAKRTTRTPLHGKQEVKYDYVTDVQKPRRGYAD